jgi:hypothetical protein
MIGRALVGSDQSPRDKPGPPGPAGVGGKRFMTWQVQRGRGREVSRREGKRACAAVTGEAESLHCSKWRKAQKPKL